MKRILRSLFLITFILWPALTQAQDLNARSPHPNAGSRQQRAADKKKAKQQKQIAKGIEEGKKRHMKIQAKETRKMMRQSRKKSAEWNDDRKEFFLKRWFRKKHR